MRTEFLQTQILEEDYLLNSSGKKIIDSVTGTSRRLDIVVVEGGELIEIREVTTSAEALQKGPQLDKTNRIRDLGPVFVRDPATRKLIPVPRSAPEKLQILP